MVEVHHFVAGQGEEVGDQSMLIRIDAELTLLKYLSKNFTARHISRRITHFQIQLPK
jgi:hypothetical protein